MSENGVKNSAFKNLMETGLKEKIKPLTRWEGEKPCIRLAQTVQMIGRTPASRRACGAGTKARLFGFVRDEKDADDNGDDEYDVDEGLIKRDAVSGYPSSLYEFTCALLLAGISPVQSPLVREKLKFVMTEAIKSYMDCFRIPVMLSAEAFIVPGTFHFSSLTLKNLMLYRSTWCSRGGTDFL